MGKTTNILDLNNRIEKLEKENVAQNNYNSLKNRPKINGNLLTGDKTGAQLGLADAQDIGNLSALTTTDKTSCVGAINEVNGGVIASVTADGVKNYSVLFDELYALLSNATILYPERLKLSVGGITILYVTTPFTKFGCSYVQANGNISHSVIMLKASGSMWRQSNISSTGAVTYDNLDVVVATNNQIISVIY